MRPYEKDPAAIYARSFATVRAEARLDRFPDTLQPLVIRLIHACGMVEIADRLDFDPRAGFAGAAALAEGAPILCDCRMVAAGIIASNLAAANDIVVTLTDPRVPDHAAAIGNTRSAAAVDLWRDRLDGAVVAIGNAPTALFRLLELLDAGAAKPAVILGFPVGFVGAAESKAELATNSRGVPFVTLRGRRGGSAMAATAVNVLAVGLQGGGRGCSLRKFGHVCSPPEFGQIRDAQPTGRIPMADPWLHVVGIGEDGLDGLSPATRSVVEAAEVILGGDRHHLLSDRITAERIAWPSPFDAMIETIRGLRGKRAVVLVTGDPLWFSVGARIGRALDPGEIVFHPQLSAFQLAAARMGWSLADVETLTVHGRPVEQMIAFIQPDQRLLILTTGAETPAQIAGFLTDRGFGQSRMTVLAAMGGPQEARFDGTAAGWDHVVPAFNTLAVDCIAAPDAALLPRVPGLADDLFRSDGTMTKQELRAITLAKLMPMRGALLWDIGCGCGSVAVEWMRAARYARAVGIEPRADRRAMAAENALALGVPGLRLIEGTAPGALDGLEPPDAIFIGGGLSGAVFDAAWTALRPLGRLVANAVTLESTAILLDLHKAHGGSLVQIGISRAAGIGALTGWRPLMPVTQWSLVKR